VKIALIRREYITHLDGVNRFIAYLAEGFIKLGYEAMIFSWCYQGVEREKLGEWFKENARSRLPYTHTHIETRTV